MGYYINPKDGSEKEAWLQSNAREELMPAWSNVPEDCFPVCWVDNGPFTAAAIAYDEGEFDAFNAPDERPKMWFVVKKELLAEFLPTRLGGTNG